MLNKDSKLFISGHRGMVGGAILRKFQAEGFSSIITRTHRELDLCSEIAVDEFFKAEKPDYVILAAAKVGGIGANSKDKTDFLYKNLQIQNNVIYHSYLNGVKKLCFLGSSCIYPCRAPQPLKEEYLLTGVPEPTNEGYALAKIVGVKLCEYLHRERGFDAISLMPCNLYGSNDYFDLKRSHVIPALIRRFTDAVDDGREEVVLWGTGNVYREFLHVDDVADATYYFMCNYDRPEFVNIGSGKDLTIRELAELIAKITGYAGKITFDATKPDGMYRKLLDTSRTEKLGWKSRISLEEGFRRTYQEYRALKAAGKITA